MPKTLLIHLANLELSQEQESMTGKKKDSRKLGTNKGVTKPYLLHRSSHI